MNRWAKSLAVAAIGILAMTVVFYAPSASGAAGEDIFKTKCAMCHGPDGAGSTPMGKKLNIRDLRSAEAQKLTDAQMSEIITNGKNKMPSFKAKLKADEITQVMAAVRALAKK